MNKQELIEKYEYLNHDCFRRVDVSEVLGDLKKLDEPEKITIPQVAADWIKWTKAEGLDLQDAMNLIAGEENEKLLRWFYHESNQETFARAWLDGYEVEKEKRYLVKMKGVSKHSNYLNYDSIDDEWYLTDDENGPVVSTYHTRKQLEEAGFGEVFNSPLFEVEEVTE